MKKLVLIVIVSAFFSVNSFCQKLTQTVRGSIIDFDNKEPLIGVTVIIIGTNPLVGTVSDVNGNFRFEKVSIGRIDLQLSYLGYDQMIVSNVVVNSAQEVVLSLTMKESVVKLKEVVIATQKKGEATNNMSLLSARSISLEETKRYTGGMDDPARVVSNFAGVAATADGSSDIIVRGNSPKYLQWRLDGIEISSPYHMNDQNSSIGALTALNNNLLATSDFYTGAFSPEYGNVLSGIMDIKLRTGNNEKFESTCGIGLMGTDVTFEGPFKKGYRGSYLLNYRYSTIALINNIGIIDIPGVVDYQDATFKMVLPTKKAGIFSVFGLGGLSGFLLKNSLFIPGTSIKNASVSRDCKKDDYLANMGINHMLTINSYSYIKTSLSYTATGMNDDLFERDTLRIYNDQGILLRDSVTNKEQIFKSRIINSAYRASVIYNNKINTKNKIQIGSLYTLNINKYYQDIYNYQILKLINVTDFNKNIGSVNNFLSWRHSFNEDITFVAGLHNMNVLFNHKYTIEPRIALNWKINNSNTIIAGYGKHSNMESVHNYFTKIKLANGSIIEPNKNLDLLKAHHYIIGYENRISDNIRIKIEAYYQYLYNLPVEKNDTSYYATINEGIDYGYVPLVNKGIGKNFGIEVTLERFFNNSYYFLLNGSLFETKYKSLEGIWRNTRYNNNFIINFLSGKEFKNLGIKQNKTLAINVKALFEGGQRYIPLLRDNNGNIAVDPTLNKYWNYKKAYDEKFENIVNINLSVSYKINMQKVTHEIFLDLMNITNDQSKFTEYYNEKMPNKIDYTKKFQFFPNLMYKVYF